MNEAKPPGLMSGIAMWAANEDQADRFFGTNREPTLAEKLYGLQAEQWRNRPWWRKAGERIGNWLIDLVLRIGGQT